MRSGSARGTAASPVPRAHFLCDERPITASTKRSADGSRVNSVAVDELSANLSQKGMFHEGKPKVKARGTINNLWNGVFTQSGGGDGERRELEPCAPAWPEHRQRRVLRTALRRLEVSRTGGRTRDVDCHRLRGREPVNADVALRALASPTRT
jgi:hypothetical protein